MAVVDILVSGIILRCVARFISINQSLYLSDMTLQHMQLQQAEFGTGQTGHEVRLQLPY